MTLQSPAELAERLDTHGYLAEAGLVSAAFLADRAHRPLLLEGAPGVGKTAFARAMARVLDTRVERVQCYPGLEAGQVLYEWNFPLQLMALRAAGQGDRSDRLPELWSDRYLIPRPVLNALRDGPAVLLIDEIDRADDDFEALLLQVLDTFEITIPELGTVRAEQPPFVVLTSNRTREVHDAIKRRCLYHWIDHPTPGRETEILRRRVEGLPAGLAAEIASAMKDLRELDLVKPPSLSEAIDCAHALLDLGATALTQPAIDAVISTLVKHHDDEPPVRAAFERGQRSA